MTREQFNNVVANFANYQGKQVEFEYYIPSANRYAKAVGFLYSFGQGIAWESFVISERNQKNMIHFSNVTLIISKEDELREALAKQGMALKPINRDSNAIKDEPKWEIVRI